MSTVKKYGSCSVCQRRYSLVGEGVLANHDLRGTTELCQGSRKFPLPDSKRSYSSADASRMSGITQHQLARWSRRGHLDATGREVSSKVHNRYSLFEVRVAHTMRRLLEAGLNDLLSAERIARQHISNLAVLESMGYDGDSNTTEHTVGDGIIISITEEPLCLTGSSPRRSAR